MTTETIQPAFNHAPGDGPFNPCLVCLPLMAKEDLILLIHDLRSPPVLRTADDHATSQSFQKVANEVKASDEFISGYNAGRFAMNHVYDVNAAWTTFLAHGGRARPEAPSLTFDDAIRIVEEKRAEFEEAAMYPGAQALSAVHVALRAARVRLNRERDQTSEQSDGNRDSVAKSRAPIDTSANPLADRSSGESAAYERQSPEPLLAADAAKGSLPNACKAECLACTHEDCGERFCKCTCHTVSKKEENESCSTTPSPASHVKPGPSSTPPTTGGASKAPPAGGKSSSTERTSHRSSDAATLASTSALSSSGSGPTPSATRCTCGRYPYESHAETCAQEVERRAGPSSGETLDPFGETDSGAECAQGVGEAVCDCCWRWREARFASKGER